MIFKKISIFESKGYLLTASIFIHSNKKKIKLSKGTEIDQKIVNLLNDNNIKHIYCAKLTKDELDENQAAYQISNRLISNKRNFYLHNLMTGRVNLKSRIDGLFFYDENQLIEINNISNDVGIGALRPFSRVKQNQTLVTTKIMPYGVPKSILKTFQKLGKNCFKILPFKKFKIDIIQTFNDSTKISILDKTKKITEDRLKNCGIDCIKEFRTFHDKNNIDKSLKKSLKNNADLILIFGVNAIADKDDLIPSVIKDNDGKVIRFGMPVEPGNLVLISTVKYNNKNKYIIGMPGCAKSPKENGVDWIIWRILTGLKIDNKIISKMSIGGLIN